MADPRDVNLGVVQPANAGGYTAPPSMGSIGSAVMAPPAVSNAVPIIPGIGSAQLPMGPRPENPSVGQAVPVEMGPPPSLMDSEMARNQAETNAYLDYLNSNRMIVNRTPDPRYPIVQEQVQNFYGAGGELEIPAFEAQPFRPPEIEAGEDEFAYQQRVADAQELDLADQQAEYDAMVEQAQANAGSLAATNVRDIGQQGHIGMAEADLQSTENVGGAVIDQEIAANAAYAMAAEAEAKASFEAEARDRARREEASLALRAVDDLRSAQAEAHKELAAMPPLAKGNWWKSASGASKFFAILGTIAGGWNGSMAIPEMIERENANELELQKANAAQVQDRANASDASVANAVNIYRNLLDAAGDEATADLMWMQVHREDAAKILEAELAKTTVPVMRAKLQESLLGVRQRIDQAKQELDLRAATTKREIVSTRRSISRHDEKIARDRLDTLDTQRHDLVKMGVGSEEKATDREAQREIAEIGARGQVAAKREEVQAKNEMDIKKASDEWGAVETLVGDFLRENPGNIHGVGAPLSGDQTDRIKTRSFQDALELLATNGFTGATATEAQADQIRSLVRGDWTEMTDEAARTRWNEIMNIASSRRRYYQKQLPSENRRVSSADELPSFRPE